MKTPTFSLRSLGSLLAVGVMALGVGAGHAVAAPAVFKSPMQPVTEQLSSGTAQLVLSLNATERESLQWHQQQQRGASNQRGV